MKYFKLILIFIICFCFTSKVQAQKEYNIWYFGEYAGLNFNTSPPTPLFNSKCQTFESSSSICDSAGNLLFYTNGNVIFNRKHDTMQNGIMKKEHCSAIQGSMILPVPLHDSLYYIILSNEFEYTHLGLYDSLQYMIVNIKLDSGRGAVIKQETPLLPRSLENFAVCQHANGIDYWVGSTENGRNRFNCVRTTNGLFTGKIISNQLIPTDSNYAFICKFSPDSKKVIANMHYVKDTLTGKNKEFIDLYKFDNISGKIYDRISIKFNYGGSSNFEFSSNSKYLYIGLTQVDLNVWDSIKIQNSIVDLRKKINGSLPQLGPDGKIYLFVGYQSNMQYINFPNKPYPYCFNDKHDVDLSPRNNNSGGPYYPNFWFRERPSINTTKTQYFCDYEAITLNAEVSDADSFKWEAGIVNNSTLRVTKAGKYVIKTYSGIREYKDTITVINTCNDINCFIPNAFSMDHNLINDSFRFSCEYVSNIITKIYNRWGEQVFYSEGMNMTWDGKYMGAPCEAGVYFFVIEVEGQVKGKSLRQEKTGIIHLMY